MTTVTPSNLNPIGSPTASSRIRISLVAVGMLCEDLILNVDSPLLPDDKVRASGRKIALGGNACNCARALASFITPPGSPPCVALLATSASIDLERIGRSLAEAKIDITWIVPIENVFTPTSYIIKTPTTRSIVHFRDNMPELCFSDVVSALNSPRMDEKTWWHFEARTNTSEIRAMMTAIGSRRRISLELERPRSDKINDETSLLTTVGLHFVVMPFSYAAAKGFDTPESALFGLREHYPLVRNWIVTRGEHGSWGLGEKDIRCAYIAAKTGEAVVNTVGAGDVYCAGLIDGFLCEFDLRAAMEHATLRAWKHVTAS